MEDIFSNDNSGSGTSYIMHKNADRTWYSNNEAITLDKIMVCPKTIKTGWGMWNGTYNTIYSDIPFIKIPKPDDDYKEAFSMNIYTNDKRSFLWSRFSFGEYQAFKKMAVQFYKDIEANEGKVPVFQFSNKYEVIQLKALNINVPLFEFLGWKERPTEFVVPIWEEPLISDGEITMATQEVSAQSQADRKVLTDDDIPF